MGDWSDYFEDFPEEDPANYVGRKFDPEGARRIRRQEEAQRKDQALLDAEISRIIQLHSKAKTN
tara:strand:- start:15907 stop:16098 length:192 start_codon:yes stop_codon:yes gene_type:complete